MAGFVRFRRFKEQLSHKTEAQLIVERIQMRSRAAEECVAVSASLRAVGQHEGAAAALTCAQRIRDLSVERP